VQRIVIAGAGATGISAAYHLALRGARHIVLCDRSEALSGATGKAFGGIRQQFSTTAEVRLAQASIRFFEQLGRGMFEQVGYLFLATTERGLAELTARAELQASLGVPVDEVSAEQAAALAPGVAVDDVVGGVLGRDDGLADPPVVARELLRRAVELGVEVREHVDALDEPFDVLVVACGPWSARTAARLGLELPVRPLCRQLFETGPIASLAERLPLVLEEESGFHFRRYRDCLRVAMQDPAPRFGFAQEVDRSLLADRLDRLARRFPGAAGATVARAWAGLYDLTPDAHPIIERVRDDVVLACGFSGHGFMQSPAVGNAVAELVLDGVSSFDLSPYRLGRFADGAIVPETLVL
jgi:sarcosine oxidase subunit beta